MDTFWKLAALVAVTAILWPTLAYAYSKLPR